MTHRRRLAFCSPVNPVESGISDYSEELLPYLGQYVDITVFVDDDVKPSNPHLAQHFAIESASRLEQLQRRRPFDAILYHMGNSAAHSRFWSTLQRVPGVVVLHDYVLHHLMLWHAANRVHDLRTYRAEVQRRYGEAGLQVAKQMERGQLPEAVFDYPLSEAVIEAAQGLIAHSRYVVDRALSIRPQLNAAVVPMGVPLPPQLERIQARQELGLPADAPIWASFGHINPYKRIAQALTAFAQFRRQHPSALYILVGSVSAHYPLPEHIKRLGLGDAVKITGFVAHADFARYVAAADLCFNGRYPSAGETSASLLRLLGAGRAVLVSDIATFSELPRDVVAHVPVGDTESALIAAYAERLFADTALRQALEANARSFVAREHSLAAAAAGYINFLCQLYTWQPLMPDRPVLWDVTASSSASGDVVNQLIGQRAAEAGLSSADVPLLERAVRRIRSLVDSNKQ